MRKGQEKKSGDSEESVLFRWGRVGESVPPGYTGLCSGIT